VINDLTDRQQRLAAYLSELSEQAWAAGWMRGVEHELWQAVVSGPRQVGRLHVTVEHIDRLRRLSADCGGWITFDDVAEETFVPIEQWTARGADRAPPPATIA